MNTKTIMGISLATVFAVSMIAPAYAGVAGYFLIEDVVVEHSGNNGVNQSVHIDLGGDVPALPADPENFGWAVVTDKGFLVIASHPVATDSTAQPPEEEMHTHFLTADLNSDDCNSGAHATFATKNEVGRLSIMGDEIWVKNVPRGLAGDLQESAFSFTLTFEDLNTDGTDSLCINPVGTFNFPPT